MPKRTAAAVDYAALANFRHALRSFVVFSERHAAAHGLTPQQHQALLALRAAEPGAGTIGFLAERLIIKPHSATGLVDRLEAVGMVRRASTENDRRRAMIELTPAALEVLEQLSASHQEELRRLRPLLTEMLGQFG